MATLQSTTINGNLTASTSFTSPLQITNTNSQVYREYTGTVSIPTSVNNPVNYVNLFANFGYYERMYGILVWWVNQSQFHSGSLTFQLSEYGLQTQITQDSSGAFSVERYSPSFGTNYLRFYNTMGTVWGNGTYYFTISRISGLGGQSFYSDYLTTRTR
jgi:hypothetical protein